jgi:hypothetical protein
VVVHDQDAGNGSILPLPSASGTVNRNAERPSAVRCHQIRLEGRLSGGPRGPPRLARRMPRSLAVAG